MSKYYTPTIEEFHVGFEYEIKDWWTLEGAMGLPGENCTQEDIDRANAHIPNPDGFTKRTLTKSALWTQCMYSVEHNNTYKGDVSDIEYQPLIGPDSRHEWERITTGIKDGTVRVKYLDRDDIEASGFTYVSDTCYKKEIGGIHYMTIFIDEKGFYDIQHHGEGSIFYGIIKNISELRKLLFRIKLRTT